MRYMRVGRSWNRNKFEGSKRHDKTNPKASHPTGIYTGREFFCTWRYNATMASRNRIRNWLQTVLFDCRFAVRQVRKEPAVTATVVITLGLGIGVNTAMFSLLNGWLLRPLPVPSPQQVTVLASQQKEGSNGNFSYPDFLDFQRGDDSFSSLFGYAFGIGGLSADGEAREIAYSSVTGNYFSALGVKPALGRLFLPGEGEKPGEELLVVLGYSFWQSKFGGDPHVIGKSVRVNGKQATVIGVTPREFHGTVFLLDMDAFLPLSAMSLVSDSVNSLTVRDDRLLTVMGRLKQGTVLKQAQSSTDVIADRLATQYPEADKGVKVRLVPERFARPGAFVATFVPVIASLFLVLAGLVLLLACTNVANMLLVRATVRSREVAIRSALGATRARIIRQVVTESLLMALLGSVAGILLGSESLAVSGSLLHSVFTNRNNRLQYGRKFRLEGVCVCHRHRDSGRNPCRPLAGVAGHASRRECGAPGKQPRCFAFGREVNRAKRSNSGPTGLFASAVDCCRTFCSESQCCRAYVSRIQSRSGIECHHGSP